MSIVDQAADEAQDKLKSAHCTQENVLRPGLIDNPCPLPDRSNRNATELLPLRGEVGVLRRQTTELEKLQDENRRLRQLLPSEPQTPARVTEEKISWKETYAYAWKRQRFGIAELMAALYKRVPS